jgi:hypothetical protein
MLATSFDLSLRLPWHREQTLFVTARTVEGHLTSVFRKLRLDSRNELWPALAERAPVSA